MSWAEWRGHYVMWIREGRRLQASFTSPGDSKTLAAAARHRVTAPWLQQLTWQVLRAAVTVVGFPHSSFSNPHSMGSPRATVLMPPLNLCPVQLPPSPNLVILLIEPVAPITWLSQQVLAMTASSIVHGPELLIAQIT